MCPLKGLAQRRVARLALAGALAEQWFGFLLVADTEADEWLLWGLQEYLQALFVRSAYGSSEVAYLRLKQREAVRSFCAAHAQTRVPVQPLDVC
jgi:hypothetical protein